MFGRRALSRKAIPIVIISAIALISLVIVLRGAVPPDSNAGFDGPVQTAIPHQFVAPGQSSSGGRNGAIRVVNATARPPSTRIGVAQRIPPKVGCGAAASTASSSGSSFPVVGTSGCVSAAPRVHTTGWTPISTGAAACAEWFVYHTNQTGNWDIFRFGPIPGEPGAKVNLSQSADKNVDNIGPSLSPDRRWMAFNSNRTGSFEVYASATDGTSVQRITNNPMAPSLGPIWSPDGKSIVYESVSNGAWNLFQFNVQNGQETQLTNSPANDFAPYWSPDSKRIIFESTRQGNLWQIYQLDLATQAVTRLTNDTSDDANPAYSPDSKMITYRASPHNALTNVSSVLYLMNADGTNPQPISDAASASANHSWSPDGSLIAYESNMSGTSGIYIYEMATGKTRLVTDTTDAVDHYAPAWKCDSKTLVFTSNVTGSPNLFKADALPIDAAPIRVENQAAKLTSVSNAAAQFPMDASSMEQASRAKLLPSPLN